MRYLNASGATSVISGGESRAHCIYQAAVVLAEVAPLLAVGRFPALAPEQQGWLASVLEAVGETDTEIGGYRTTRLLDAVAVGDTILPVENCADWLPAGRVALDGVVYHYTFKGVGLIGGIGYLFNGELISGARRAHAQRAEVLDLGNPYNLIQQGRRAVLVDYAAGDNLAVVGRNLGVFRDPYLADDETYRKVVKALAYNPRGTMYGIRLALDSLVGAGNYQIIEDLIRQPCTVFFQFDPALFASPKSIGHAYLTDTEGQRMTLPAKTVALDHLPVNRGYVQGVKWRDMRFLYDLGGGVWPSEIVQEDYDGDVGTALWEYVGSSESTKITPGSTYVTFEDAGPTSEHMHYRIRTRTDRWGDGQGLKITVLFCIPSGYCHNNSPQQWGVRCLDGWRLMSAGVRYTGGVYLLSLVDNYVPVGPDTTILSDTWYELTLEKRPAALNTPWDSVPEPQVVLSLNGREIATRRWSDFMAPTEDPFIAFGQFEQVGITGIKAYARLAGVEVTAPQDFLEGYFSDGAVTDGSNNLASASAAFTTGDTGKRVWTKFSGTANPYGGNNNGVWKIQSVVSSAEVELRGDAHTGAWVETAHPKRIVVPAEAAFVFPRDLGRKITITGSTLGNDGTYTVEKLLQESTETDLATFLTPGFSEKTTICEVEEAVTFVTEAGLSFYTQPNFVAEALIFTLSSAAVLDVVAGVPTLQIRGELWAGSVINASVQAAYSRVLTAQIMEESVATLTSVGDDAWNPYAFYIADPLGFVRKYLDELTVAGVIADYLGE